MGAIIPNRKPPGDPGAPSFRLAKSSNCALSAFLGEEWHPRFWIEAVERIVVLEAGNGIRPDIFQAQREDTRIGHPVGDFDPILIAARFGDADAPDTV